MRDQERRDFDLAVPAKVDRMSDQKIAERNVEADQKIVKDGIRTLAVLPVVVWLDSSASWLFFRSNGERPISSVGVTDRRTDILSNYI